MNKELSKYLATIGAKGGQARSKAKTKAASENAKKNTGPRKSKMRLALELALSALDGTGDPLSLSERSMIRDRAIAAIEVALKPRKRKK